MVAKETIGISVSWVPYYLEIITAALPVMFPERKSENLRAATFSEFAGLFNVVNASAGGLELVSMLPSKLVHSEMRVMVYYRK